MMDSAKLAVEIGPWARAITRMQAFSEENGARIIGITGDQRGVGVSLLCQELALAYTKYGTSVLLIDASGGGAPSGQSAAENGAAASDDLLALASGAGPAVTFMNFSDFSASLPTDRQAMRQLLERMAGEDRIIVVDLPPVHAQQPADIQMLSRSGGACQLVFLVCLSGTITKNELSDCVATCRINQVTIGGVIVNDWKQAGAWLATGW